MASQEKLNMKLTEYRKFSMSRWLQDQIEQIGHRDPVDLYRDVCELKDILRAIAQEELTESE